MSGSRNGRPDRTRGVILAPVESETALGGRVVDWVDSGVVWFGFDTRGLRERAERELGQARLVETARVLARAHPAVARGVRLATRDGDWRVTVVEALPPRAGAPDRNVLHLERV